jgi:hypothetical protein
MKASEMIKTLQTLIDKHGDLEVVSMSFDEWGEPEDWTACKIWFDDEDKQLVIVGK